MILAHRLDHCAEIACDFQRHYLPQARLVAAGQEGIVAGWLYPPFLALSLLPLAEMDDATAVTVWLLVGLFFCVLLAGLSAAGIAKSRWKSWLISLSLVASSLSRLENGPRRSATSGHGPQ